MNHVSVTYSESEKFVAKQQSLGSDVRWDGWDIVIFLPAKRAIYTKEGVRRVIKNSNVWGFEERVTVDASGNWRIPKRYVKSTRTTRN